MGRSCQAATAFCCWLVVGAASAAAARLAVDLDGDTDHSGRIDGSADEEAAESHRPVLLLANCDDDDRNGVADHQDRRVNGAGDLEDLEPVVLRRLEGARDLDVRLRLRLSKAAPVRVFGPSGDEILGPLAGGSYALTEADRERLEAGDLTFLIEGLRFGEEAVLTARVAKRDASLAPASDRLTLKVAPFVSLPHSQEALDAFVVRTFSVPSREFVSDFRAACRRSEVAPHVENSFDVWMQDEMQWGYTQTARATLPVVLHMHRQRPLQAYVRSLLAPDVGYFRAFDYPAEANSLDYGGNLEVTPPVEGFPLGRIYLGGTPSQDTAVDTFRSRRMHPRLQGFLRRQGMQAPIRLRTDWLTVGHVDEIVSFLPDRRNDSFVMVLASPRRGLEILRRLPPETPLHANYRATFGLTTVGQMFEKTYLLRSFEDYNLDIDARIFGTDPTQPEAGSVKRKLMEALGLPEERVIELPVLFYNLSAGVWQASAMTPNLVNVTSVGDLVLVGDPFFAELRAVAEEAFTALGLQAEWMDDWRVYHSQLGNVHCGTNEMRAPFVGPGRGESR
jgi:protein-arginine deiminase